MSMRRCLKCRKEYDKTKTECPACGTKHSPGAEKLGYLSFAIVGILFILPDLNFYMVHGRLPANIDEFLQAVTSLFSF
ncbi:MAG: hypothetical protein JKY17_02615 [Magnetovibrio sp.]|nr:hypothetical protein [Magnetovibrio sp.]